MSSGGSKSSNGGAGIHRPHNAEAARKWVAEETRAEAKEIFSQHTRETSNLDVLSRCKKLNELLNSDVLKGKGNSKEQLKEILGILHSGPKRPSILDKPGVVASATRRAAHHGTVAKQPVAPRLARIDPDEVDAQAPRPPQARVVAATPPEPDDVDDLIGLLNDAPSVACTPCQLSHATAQPISAASPAHAGLFVGAASPTTTEQKASGEVKDEEQRSRCEGAKWEREARAEEDRQLRAAQEEARRKAEEAEARRKAEEAEARRHAEEAEARRHAEEAEARRQAEVAEARRQAEEAEAERQRRAREEQAEMERQREAAAAEALRQECLRHKAAVTIQSQWRALCARRLAAQLRQRVAEEQAASAAACVLQAAWRARQVALEYRQRLAAAQTLQCAVRAWRARHGCFQRLRVEAFARQRAARVIQRAFRLYRARGYTLGPLRVPTRGGARPQSGLDGTALLAKQLRLRSAVDARLAPESAPGGGSAADDDSALHPTVITHRERAREVRATERHRRSGLGERTIMVASEHRTSNEALYIARQGIPSTAAAPEQSMNQATSLIPLPPSRHNSSRSSSGRPSDSGSVRWQPPSGNTSRPASSVGRRMSSSLRQVTHFQ